MILNILDTKKEGGSTCILGKSNLADYINSLGQEFDKFDIQRGIVNNYFLDKLVDTVLSNKTIPPIVLIAEPGNYKYLNDNQKIELSKFSILDGLQRSYRLKQIWNAIEFLNVQLKKSNAILSIEKKITLSIRYSKELQEKEIPSTLLYSVLDYYRKQDHPDLEKALKKNTQWFEIWVDLDGDKQVEKMLILNAGHKQVNIRHQLELLFLSLIPKLKKIENIIIYREKEKDALTYGKERVMGEFHFSHLIAAIISIIEEKPVPTNTKLVKRIQELGTEGAIYKEYFNYSFFKSTINFLTKLDRKLNSPKWIGRESVLTGMFGALSNYSMEHNLSIENTYNLLLEKTNSNTDTFNLKEYYKQNEELRASKINIGSVHRNVTYKGVQSILEGSEKIKWSQYFNQYK